MFVIEHSLDSAMFEVGFLQLFRLQHVLSNLKLKGFKYCLVIKVAWKFDIGHELAHIYEGKSNVFKHLFQKSLLIIQTKTLITLTTIILLFNLIQFFAAVIQTLA